MDYAALHEIKIEEVDCDDDFDDTGIVFQDKAEKTGLTKSTDIYKNSLKMKLIWCVWWFQCCFS